MDPQLLGTGGTYYVMSQLALQGFHASCTFGNAPYVDVLVSAADGRQTLAIQVKTAFKATRGRVPYELQWPLGRRAAKIDHPNFFFALVDLKELAATAIPDVYIVPSAFVSSYCAPWVDEVKWVRLHIAYDAMQPFKNNWDSLHHALDDSFSSPPSLVD